MVANAKAKVAVKKPAVKAAPKAAVKAAPKAAAKAAPKKASVKKVAAEAKNPVLVRIEEIVSVGRERFEELAKNEQASKVIELSKARLAEVSKVAEELGALHQENVDAILDVRSAAQDAVQVLVSEIVEFSKVRYDDTSAVVKALGNVKTAEEAMNIQRDFAKSSYENLLAEGTKLVDMVQDLAKDVVEPIQARIDATVKFVKREAA